MSSKSNDNKQSNSIPYEKLWSILTRVPIIKNIRQYNLEAFSLKSLIKQGLKEDTLVATIKSHTNNVPTLLIEQLNK